MLILFLLSALLPLPGCICLAFSQYKHAKKIFEQGEPLPRPAACRRWACGFLLLSLLGFLLGSGVDFAIILWPMLVGVEALLVALLIAFRPAWLRVLRILPGLCAMTRREKRRIEECVKGRAG